jgi:CBS domain-containing protein
VAKKIMNKNFDITNPETSFKKAKALIKTTESTCIVVLNDNKLVGIFTKSDLEKIKKNDK